MNLETSLLLDPLTISQMIHRWIWDIGGVAVTGKYQYQLAWKTARPSRCNILSEIQKTNSRIENPCRSRRNQLFFPLEQVSVIYTPQKLLIGSPKYIGYSVFLADTVYAIGSGVGRQSVCLQFCCVGEIARLNKNEAFVHEIEEGKGRW